MIFTRLAICQTGHCISDGPFFVAARDFKYTGKTKNYAEVPVFLDSKATRLIQLADMVAFALFRHDEHQDSRWFELIKHCFDSEGAVQHGLYVKI